MSQIVERVAQKIAVASHHTWAGLSERARNRYRTQAIAAIQEMVEPTSEMLREGMIGVGDEISEAALRTTWGVMVAAALR